MTPSRSGRATLALAAVATAAALLAPPALARHRTPASARRPFSSSASAVKLMTPSPVALGRSAVLLAGDRIHVRGTVSHHLAGQSVTLLLARGGHAVRRLTVTPVGGSSGRFAVSLRLNRPGRYLLRAAGVSSGVLGIQVIGGGLGDRLSVRALQEGLADLNYQVSHSGSFDLGTQLAVLAYRKVNGMDRSSAVNRDVMRRVLRGRGAFHPRSKGPRHVEANLGEQVIALVNPGGRVFRVIPTSSGKASTPTVLGRFHVYQKDPGTNGEGMFDSNYFIGGYAIHGYPDVPTYAASHGCLRIPNSMAPFVFGWIRIGDEVDVYP